MYYMKKVAFAVTVFFGLSLPAVAIAATSYQSSDSPILKANNSAEV
jgi:hypothetical protein